MFEADEWRVDGPFKVTGRARYAADASVPGELWARFLASPVPHARIVSVDTSAARSLPGVVAVLTGADIRPARFGRQLVDWPILAWDRVRFAGDRVAAVAAETLEQAEAAVQAIQVEYDELPAVFEVDEALLAEAPILHSPEEAAEYGYLAGQRPSMPHPNMQGQRVVRKGLPVDDVLAGAYRVFDHTFSTARQHQGYMEPQACTAWLDDEGNLHVVSTNKTPFALRSQLAVATGLPVERITVDSRTIGGDFGGKGVTLDEFGCAFLARATGRPVRSVRSYLDELTAPVPRHASTIRLRTGVDREGRFLAHATEMLVDGGAYAAGKPAPPLLVTGGFTAMAPYHVPNTRLEVTSVYTNQPPGGHMRAPGEVQARFAGESHVDIIARELGMDPMELRLLNALRPGQTGPGGEHIREQRGVEVLETLRAAARWGEASGAANRGRGIALGTRPMHGGRSVCRLRLLPDATLELATASPDQGTGSHTLLQRVAAAELSVPPGAIRVAYQPTDGGLFDSGAGASRVTWVAGQAARSAAVAMRERLQDLAAEVLGWHVAHVRLADGRFVAGDTGESESFGEVVRHIVREDDVVEVEAEYESPVHGHDEPADFCFSAYMAEVVVDPETGEVTVEQVMLVADVGTIVNPISHQGQLDGGLAFGIGAALMEDLAIEDGRVVTPSLGEYKLPTQLDMPRRFQTILLPTPVGPGPFEAKMAGELNNATAAPAIANAIAAAVGARVMSLPITAEKVLGSLRSRV